MKTTGAAWKAYLASWPDGQWFDESNETFNGKPPAADEPEDTDVVEFSEGVVFRDPNDQEGWNLVTHFRRWEKGQTEATVLCVVPKARLSELAPLLKSIGGRTVK